MPLYTIQPCPEIKKIIKWPYFSKYSKDINLISGKIVHMSRNTQWIKARVISLTKIQLFMTFRDFNSQNLKACKTTFLKIIITR